MARKALPKRKVLTAREKRVVFETFNGCCAGCGMPFRSIKAVRCWDHGVMRWLAEDAADTRYEQVKNFRPLCDPCTDVKDAADAAIRAKVRHLTGETGRNRIGRIKPAWPTRGFYRHPTMKRDMRTGKVVPR